MKVVSLSEIETKCNKIHISIGLIVLFTIPLRYIAEQQRIISHFFLKRLHMETVEKGETESAEDIHERITRVMKKRNQHGTTTAAVAAVAAPTNVVKTVKTCVILC